MQGRGLTGSLGVLSVTCSRCPDLSGHPFVICKWGFWSHPDPVNGMNAQGASPALPFLAEPREGLAVLSPSWGWVVRPLRARPAWLTNPEAGTALQKLMEGALLATGFPHPVPWAWPAGQSPGT